MKGQIFIDIDGVVRDLMFFISPRPKKWSDGSPIFKLVRDHPEILLTSPATKYCYTLIKGVSNPIFLSTQPQSWRQYTTAWVYEKFIEYCIYKNPTIVYTKTAEEKLHYLAKNDILIEDYSQIVLIDYPFNRIVKNPLIRIKTVKQLRKFLCYFVSEKVYSLSDKKRSHKCRKTLEIR